MRQTPIYWLKEPDVLTRGKERAFSISSASMGLPGINCWGVPGACGRIGGLAHNRIRVAVPQDHPLHQQARMPVLPKEFEQIAQNVRESLVLAPDAPLLPGTEIGFVQVDYQHRPIASFEWPDIHAVIVTEAVRQLLAAHAFTGWETAPIIVVKKRRAIDLPPLYELVVTGRGGILAEPPPTLLSTCPVCGRQEMSWEVLQRLEFDLSQWDGSDLMVLPPPLAASIFVTEKVKVALESSSLTNYVLVPFDMAKTKILLQIEQEVARRKQKEIEQQQ